MRLNKPRQVKITFIDGSVEIFNNVRNVTPLERGGEFIITNSKVYKRNNVAKVWMHFSENGKLIEASHPNLPTRLYNSPHSLYQSKEQNITMCQEAKNTSGAYAWESLPSNVTISTHADSETPINGWQFKWVKEIQR